MKMISQMILYTPSPIVAVPRLESKNIVSGVFPLHCQEDLVYLRQTWVLGFLRPQPLGEKMVHVMWQSRFSALTSPSELKVKSLTRPVHKRLVRVM